MAPYQIIAFVLWCSFYAAYLLKMILLARNGIKGSILGKNTLEKTLLVVTYGGAAVQCISIVFPQLIWSFPSAFPGFMEGGSVLMLCAVAIFIAAMTTMKSNWRAGFVEDQSTELVTQGIFSISRNPAFVGFDLLYIGCALAFPNILNIVVALAAVVLFHLQILAEERFLQRAFGQAYANYRQTVMRYLGRRR